MKFRDYRVLVYGDDSVLEFRDYKALGSRGSSGVDYRF